MSESRPQPHLIDASRSSDHSLLPQLHGTEHIVQFYEDDEFLGEAVARFLGAGLVASEPLVVIATAEHRQAFSERLRSKGFDVDRAREQGGLTLLDAGELLSTFMLDGQPDWERFNDSIGSVLQKAAAVNGSTRIRAYGEMVDLLWRDGNAKAAIRVEEYWNQIAEIHPLSLLCAYVMGNFYKETDGEQFQRVCSAHTHVIPAESYREADDREKRMRQVSLLQQRARALEAELKHRTLMEQELRSARAAAEAARQEAECASRAKDEFLAMLGHELRNPLAPIITALELMKLKSEGRKSREQEIIERQTTHLIRLVDDLLDVSRIATGKVELRKKTVDLRDVLAKATEIASPLFEQRRHHFQVVTLPGGMRLHGDEVRLAQVFANLLTNAARYTNPGGHISVEARREGGELVVEVSDDGIGISPDLLPRVFDLFVQGRQSSERPTGGLGLGLTLVQALVVMHDGKVEAHSAGAGKGSMFVVRLPALEADLEAGAPSALSLACGGNSTGRRILVVDDNEDALEMLSAVLRSAGYEVRTATTGPAALQVIKEFPPQVAILDIGLPVIDGYELATRIRAEMGQNAPSLLALTGYGQESDRLRSQAAGFSCHLVKPLEMSRLLQTIERELALT